MTSIRNPGRVAGLWYLLLVLFGPLRLMYIPNKLFVRGEATEESDIDFLVDLAPGRTLLDHAALLLDLERLLQRRVDVVTERALRTRIRDHILREAISL